MYKLRLDKWKLRSTILFIIKYFGFIKNDQLIKSIQIKNSVLFFRKLRWKLLDFFTKKKEKNMPQEIGMKLQVFI